jgi:phenazine biosynthesis protein phzE
VEEVERLADLPDGDAERPVLAVVPYRRIRERGFDAVDDGAPLLALRATERALVDVDDLLAALPDGPAPFTETGYDVADADHERTVRAVLDEEIAGGAGSNFVIHRSLTGRFDAAVTSPAKAALVVLKRLLAGESSAYWTFAVHTPHRTFVGATPERQVSLDARIARMNPISGTLRYPPGGYPDAAGWEAAVLDFLADPKERDELAMVVDEELTMMAVVGDRGGRVRGPYLKPMAHLSHTEYVIEGRTSFDPRAVLRATMFAPTVTARFWLEDRMEDDGSSPPAAPRPPSGGGADITVVNAEDDFTGMLAHLLGSLGHRVTVRDWDAPDLTFSLGAGRRVHAVRGPGLVGVQFHPESVLTTEGRVILAVELGRLLGRE